MGAEGRQNRVLTGPKVIRIGGAASLAQSRYTVHPCSFYRLLRLMAWSGKPRNIFFSGPQLPSGTVCRPFLLSLSYPLLRCFGSKYILLRVESHSASSRITFCFESNHILLRVEVQYYPIGRLLPKQREGCLKRHGTPWLSWSLVAASLFLGNVGRQICI